MEMYDAWSTKLQVRFFQGNGTSTRKAIDTRSRDSLGYKSTNERLSFREILTNQKSPPDKYDSPVLRCCGVQLCFFLEYDSNSRKQRGAAIVPCRRGEDLFTGKNYNSRYVLTPFTLLVDYPWSRHPFPGFRREFSAGSGYNTPETHRRWFLTIRR